MKSVVIIEEAKKLNYFENYVALPDNYGTKAYFEREDIKEIIRTVYAALDKLDEKVNFTKEFDKNRPVLIKPNLVSVYHKCGLDNDDYPESTDPRVFEAVVSYIKQYTADITIVESSGKPAPTETSFKTAGYDKISRYYHTGLIALEKRPVVHYVLPKAEVMKEVYLPDVFEDVVNGKTFYISVPKMKTNLYTGVTLGFKNAMGTIPYYLRERNHNYNIDKKLADLLYLFKPNLTVIDGIIGGEGNTPAPVDPVEVRKIVASNNSVEADRITTYMMGFDPDKNKLIIEATKRKFGDSKAEIIGEASVTKFRPAISSLFDDKTKNEYPGLLVVAGHTINDAPKITDKNTVSPEIALKLEQACSGGCLAATKTGLDYYNYKKKIDKTFSLCVIEGEGVLSEGERYWFDRTGKPYTKEDLKALPIKKYAMGDCAAKNTSDICDFVASGCCDPAKCMSTICAATGHMIPIMSVKNKSLASMGIGMLDVVFARSRHIIEGNYVDCPRAHEDKIFEIQGLSEEDMKKDYIKTELPKMSGKEKIRGVLDQVKVPFSSIILPKIK